METFVENTARRPAHGGRSETWRLTILSRSGAPPSQTADDCGASYRADVPQLLDVFAAARDALDGRVLSPRRARRLARLLWRLSLAAFTDPLTGLQNRRGLVRDGSRLLARATQDRQSVMLLFLDIDGLKRVNDSGGHAAGDELICSAAQALQATFRGSDVVARLGGDEFVVLSAGVRGDTAAAVLRRLASVLMRINRSRPLWPVELSVGVALSTPHRPLDLAALLERADRRMYDDKRARRALAVG